MQPAPDLYELIYVSTIAPKELPDIVARIAAHARVSNDALGITGLLIYDGQRFAQHLEGSEIAVLDLYARIKADPRHIAISLRYQGACLRRRYPKFSMGFADLSRSDDLEALESLSGPAVLKALANIYEKADLYL